MVIICGTIGNYYTYVQLKPNANIDKVNAEIKNIAIRHDPKTNGEVFLYPFSKMHLYSRFDNGKPVGGRIEIVHLLLGIAGIILLIARINFMNLSTAQSQKRAKRGRCSQSAGCSKTKSYQPVFDRVDGYFTLIAGFVALVLVQLCLPAFNQLTAKNLFVNYFDPMYWLAFLGFILFTGLLAGSYPAFFLSACRPVKVLKGKFNGARMSFNPRKVLVVLQFVAAIVFVITTVVIYRQIKFAQGRDIGYHIDNLVEVPVEGDIRKNYVPIKNDLLAFGRGNSRMPNQYRYNDRWRNNGWVFYRRFEQRSAKYNIFKGWHFRRFHKNNGPYAG